MPRIDKHMSTYDPDRALEYVQPIVLLVDRVDPAPDVDGIAAVALASVTAFAHAIAATDDLDSWTEWLSGLFAKSVRRADRKTFDKVWDEFSESGATRIKVGHAEAIAFAPVRANELPRTLSRLQVSGTELPRADGAAPVANAVTITVNSDLGMSTGKAAAQAAHALFAFRLDRRTHADADPAVRIVYATAAEIRAELSARPNAIIIEDAGRTEIEPGSLTAIAY